MVSLLISVSVASANPTIRVNELGLATAPYPTEVCFPGEARWRRKSPSNATINQPFMDGGRISCFAKDGYVSILACFDLDADLDTMPEQVNCSVGDRTFDIGLERVSVDSGPWRVWTPDEDDDTEE
ncbi:MAG: hypothetical protein H6738_05250 [Alphaproteobacteria bacterium]|nr:hypothetical protein [Alphaproteobacteria bacterium]MCB9696173.1 hypothetical protein [Alphaproteobacteria bacterium]